MISISANDVKKTKQIFEALQLCGAVHQPLEETPFGPAFGKCNG